LAASSACSAILGVQSVPPANDSGSSDGTVGGDASPPDSGEDVGAMEEMTEEVEDNGPACTPQDAGVVVGDAKVPTVWSAFDTDAGSHAWTPFDLTTISATVSHYQGGAFDGRYLYLAPNTAGTVVQYDTQAAFSSTTSWSLFDTTAMPWPAGDFSGAVFDGRYVTFVPWMPSGPYAGVVARYDTQAGDFSSAKGWTSFSIAGLPGVAAGYRGGGFDGRYGYFVPYSGFLGDGGQVRDGVVVRWDPLVTLGDGGTPAGWTAFDVASENPAAAGFFGSVFDGQYLYLVPYANALSDNGGFSGMIARYNTQLSFGNPGAWTTFDMSTLPGGQSYGFQGAAFDGKYLYYAPSRTTVVTRYTAIGGVFNAAIDYTSYDLSPLIGPDASASSPHFATAAFDGRYIYFLPAQKALGTVVRYDTMSLFTAPCAWSSINLTDLNALAQEFVGAVYDGQYLYFVPAAATVVMRFNTKTVPSMPALPAFHGSFY
jgi:hypothetical protein